MTPPLLPERLENALGQIDELANLIRGIVKGHEDAAFALHSPWPDTVAAHGLVITDHTAVLRACIAELVRERDEARHKLTVAEMAVGHPIVASHVLRYEQVATALQAAKARAERAEAALREIAAGARSQGAHVGMSWLRVERIAERVLQAEAHAGTAEEPPKPVSLVAALKEAVAKEAGRKMLNNDVSLKACWRCGGDAFLTTPIGNSCYVACNNGICGATSPAFTGKHRAVRWWNQRAGAVESGLVPVPQDGLAPTGSEQPASPAPLGREPSREAVEVELEAIAQFIRWSGSFITPADNTEKERAYVAVGRLRDLLLKERDVPSGPDPVRAAAQEYFDATQLLLDWLNDCDLSADHRDKKPEDFERIGIALERLRAALAAQTDGTP